MARSEIMARKTTLKEEDSSFDTAFWETVSPDERLQRVWTLSREVWEMAGKLPGEEGRPRATARIHRP